MDRSTLGHISRLLGPLASRVANTVARGVVQLVNDAKKLQLVQLGVLDDETIDDAEHHQPYGFSSVPLDGAEAVVVFPNGDRSHPLVVSISDRRYRPTGGAPGQVDIYHYTGARMTFVEGGDIELHPAPGKKVKVIGGGSAAALATKADIDALKTWASTHVHGGSGTPPTTPPPTPAGTSVLEGE